MQLSILIPTYNYDCRTLVQSLLDQLQGLQAEVVVADDASTDARLKEQNRQVAEWRQCRIWEASHNMGRAAIRNRLADMAQGDWLLFIDSDARVDDPCFIQNYLAEADCHDVICGGTGNLKECPSPGVILRWKYEVKAEQRLTLEHRRTHPYSQFTTFNFLIRKDLFQRIRFDEQCHEYGHEDTLFGLDLKKQGADVWHIDNKLTHLGLEEGPDYLRKVETALRTLSGMDGTMQRNARISSLSIRLKGIHWLIRIWHHLFSGMERKQLLGPRPSLSVFNLYKLGFYVSTL